MVADRESDGARSGRWGLPVPLRGCEDLDEQEGHCADAIPKMGQQALFVTIELMTSHEIDDFDRRIGNGYLILSFNLILKFNVI